MTYYNDDNHDAAAHFEERRKTLSKELVEELEACLHPDASSTNIESLLLNQMHALDAAFRRIMAQSDYTNYAGDEFFYKAEPYQHAFKAQKLCTQTIDTLRRLRAHEHKIARDTPQNTKETS